MDEKQRIRAVVRKRRSERVGDTAAYAIAAVEVTSVLVRLTQDLAASRVCCFVSVRGEPDTSGYLAWAHANGVEVLLPRSLAGGELEWSAYVPGELAPGAFGIPEPQGPAVESGSASLLLIPAAAVDRTGARLGWGRGFYDRELAACDAGPLRPRPPVFAVVFEEEVLASLPVEPHDVPVHGAVTEERIHRFG